MKPAANIRSALLLPLAMLAFSPMFISSLLGADAAALLRQDVVHLKDGGKVRGTILFSGPRGVVMVTEKDSDLERFIAAEKINRVERGKADPDSKKDEDESAAAGIVRHYTIEGDTGQLRLAEVTTASTVKKAAPDEGEEGNKKPEKEPGKDKKNSRPSSGRPTILNTGRNLDDSRTSKDDAAKQEEDKLLNLFGGPADSEKEKKEGQEDDRIVRD